MTTRELVRQIREGERYELFEGECSKAVTLRRAALINQGQGMMFTPSDMDAEWIQRNPAEIRLSPNSPLIAMAKQAREDCKNGRVRKLP